MLIALDHQDDDDDHRCGSRHRQQLEAPQAKAQRDPREEDERDQHQAMRDPNFRDSEREEYRHKGADGLYP